jgi:hypothetical protein
MTNAKITKQKPERKSVTQPFRVGDRVSFQFAGQRRVARIVEDRGRIGLGGRQLLRVVYVGAAGDQSEGAFEVPADGVTRAPTTSRRKHPTTKAKAHA